MVGDVGFNGLIATTIRLSRSKFDSRTKQSDRKRFEKVAIG